MKAGIIIPILLLGFWIYLAWRSFSNGNVVLACVFLVVGILVTIWRVMRVLR